jgi:uncharacterized protein YecT (DUF1311 family)
MVIIHTADNKTSFYINDTPIPVTVGSVDNENKTVNFNVKLVNGNPEIWTLQQVWDAEGKTFHLRATLGREQDDLSFVRKVSVDDLNRLAALSNPKGDAVAAALPEMPAADETAADTAAAAQAADAAMGIAEPEGEYAAADADAAPRVAASPSFDCAKASTDIERLICGSADLAQMDQRLSEVYKDALRCATDSNGVIASQREWVRSDRGGCGTEECLIEAYMARIGALEAECEA